METMPPPADGDAELRALALELDAADRAATVARQRMQAGVFTMVVAAGLLIMVGIGGLFLSYVVEMGVIPVGAFPFMTVWVAMVLIAGAVGATGWAFMRGHAAARVPLWVIAVVALPFVPAGTAFGAYLIWVLLKTAEPA